MALDNFKVVKYREAENESFEKGTKTSVKIHTKQKKTTTVTTETTTKNQEAAEAVIESKVRVLTTLETGEMEDWDGGGRGVGE